MDKLDASQIRPTDIVLVEANITRYVPTESQTGSPHKETGSPSKRYKTEANATSSPFQPRKEGEMSSWVTSLELRAISLLAEGPRIRPGEDDGPSFDIQL